MRFSTRLEQQQAPKIYDPDALDRMAAVEGEQWKQLQLSKRNNAYGFFAYLAAWQAIEKEGVVGEMTPHEAIMCDMVSGVKGSDGAIYGNGGYTRYSVARDGTIRFDYGLARQEKQELAKQQGFPPG